MSSLDTSVGVWLEGRSMISFVMYATLTEEEK